MIQELKFEELSVEQKIGMVTCALIAYPENRTKASDEFVLNLIKNHALGCLWIKEDIADRDEFMAKIKEVCDYPLLIVTDAERGIQPYPIGRHNAIGMTDNEELAYAFGKVTAVTARKLGYNVVCNPVVDRAIGEGICGNNSRSLGSDKYKLTALAKAIARGMHDGGILTVAKHYPSAQKSSPDGRLIDPHMAESASLMTKEELIEESLYPYTELMKEGLLDGIMTAHCRLPNIDPDYPASLSKKVIGIIRELGFDGFAITDALCMMGIIAKFGDTDSKGLSIENGNDLALLWETDNIKGFEAMMECYKKGVLSIERIDEATKKVLAAQHKVFEMQPKFEEVTQEDADKIDRISKDSVFAKCDEELDASISRDGKHLFIVLADNEATVSAEGKIEVDTFTGGWFYPTEIIEKLKQDFPNSEAVAIKQYPAGMAVSRILRKAADYEDVVFILQMEGGAYLGRELFTPRIVSMIEAMQIASQISTVVHFGNPYALERLPHIPRILIGSCSKMSVDATLEVLEGNYPAKGSLTYDVKFE